MLTVLIIVENLPVPLDRRVWQEATALVRSGFQVCVICPKAGKYTSSYQELEGVRIFRHSLPVQGDGVLRYLAEYGWAWLAEFFLTLKIVLKYKVNVIQACNPPDNIFLIGVFFRFFTGVKFVFDHHDPFADLFALKFPKKRWLQRAVEWCERSSLKSADHVITTSEELRRLAIRRSGILPEKITLVRSGFDLKRVPRLEPDSSLKQGRKFLALYIGVMGAQDGLDLLLKAAASVVHDFKRDDIQFVLAGGGSEMPAMQELAASLRLDDHVKFTGYLEGSALYNLLATADVGLCPDPKNDFNDKLSMNKILEYMAFGLPVVQFDLNEGHFLAEDAALYAENNDPVELAKCLIRLIDDPAERQLKGAIGKDRVTRLFAWDKQEAIYINQYKRLFSKNVAAVTPPNAQASVPLD